MRPTEALRCLLFAGLTASGPWLAHAATALAGAPPTLAWSGVLLALAGCFAWMVRADLRRDTARDRDPAEAWSSPREHREA